MLHQVYLVCFLVGGIITVLNFVLGGIADLDFDFDFDFGFDLDVSAYLPLKPFLIMAFITVFGGVGLILSNTALFSADSVRHVFSIPIAVVAGYLASMSINKFIYIPLKKSEVVVKKQADAIGEEATILETIIPGGFGRISYSIDGNVLSAAAKEVEPGDGYKKGEKVIIYDIADNVFFVTKYEVDDKPEDEPAFEIIN